MGEVTYWGLTGRVRVLTREGGRGYLRGLTGRVRVLTREDGRGYLLGTYWEGEGTY